MRQISATPWQVGRPKRTISNKDNVILGAPLRQFWLGKARISLDLEHGGFDCALFDQAGQLYMVEVGDANRAYFSRRHQLLHCAPRFQVVNVVKLHLSRLLTLRHRVDVVVGMFASVLDARRADLDFLEATGNSGVKL